MANIKKIFGIVFLVIGIIIVVFYALGILGIWRGTDIFGPAWTTIQYYFVFIIVIGIGILVLGAILLNQGIQKQKLNLITQSDINGLFACPKCGFRGAIRVIILEKDRILVKQRCPNHGEKLIRIPINLLDQCFSHFQNCVFRCLKCGQEAHTDEVRFSGHWTWIKLFCPSHRNDLPYYKIWRSVYDEISNLKIE